MKQIRLKQYYSSEKYSEPVEFYVGNALDSWAPKLTRSSDGNIIIPSEASKEQSNVKLSFLVVGSENVDNADNYLNSGLYQFRISAGATSQVFSTNVQPLYDSTAILESPESYTIKVRSSFGYYVSENKRSRQHVIDDSDGQYWPLSVESNDSLHYRQCYLLNYGKGNRCDLSTMARVRWGQLDLTPYDSTIGLGAGPKSI